MRWEFSVWAEGRHIFGRRPKPRAAKPQEKPAFTSGRRAQNASSEWNEQTEILSLIYDKCMQPGSRNRDKLMH